jgi:hypothetical protein
MNRLGQNNFWRFGGSMGWLVNAAFAAESAWMHHRPQNRITGLKVAWIS